MKNNNLIALQRKHFNTKEKRYDIDKILYPPVHTILETNEIIKLLAKKKWTKIIDLGSGNGRLTIPLLKAGYKVTAVDISRKSLEELRSISKKLKMSVKTVQNLKSAQNSEAVVGCDILHHVDLKVELERIYKKLQKGGIIIFSEPNGFNPVWYLYIIYKGIWKAEKNIVYINYLHLGNVLNDIGYKNITIKGFGLFPRSIFRNEMLCKINDVLGNLPILKLFAYRFIIFASK